MKNRLCSVTLILVILLGTLPSFASAAEQDIWSNASSWAVDSLTEAQRSGLIPEIMDGADFTKPITRAEFAHLIVLMLETYTGVSTQPETLIYPFNDTEDPDVYKAFGFGIMDRTDDKEALFSPDETIDRETMAYMFVRAIRLVAPLADYSVSESVVITDFDKVSSWAGQQVKYLYTHGIVTGGDDSTFMPRPVTDAQKAAGYGMATREQCVAVVSRLYKALPEIQSSRFAIDYMADEIMSYAIDEPQGGEEISRDDLWTLLNPYSLKVRWAANTHALSFVGDFIKTEGEDWEKGYDSALLYNAFSSDGANQIRYDEELTLWGAAAGSKRFALTVFNASPGMLSAYEWTEGADTGTLVKVPVQTYSLFSSSTLRDYLPGRLDWTYRLYDDAVINGECCKVFSVTTKQNLIQGEGPNIPEDLVEETEYFYVSTVSGLNVLITNYGTLHETTYMSVKIVFTISPSLTDASKIEPPENVSFGP